MPVPDNGGKGTAEPANRADSNSPIIEAFSRLRELSRTIGEMSASKDGTETGMEPNFALLKLKHRIKRK